MKTHVSSMSMLAAHGPRMTFGHESMNLLTKSTPGSSRPGWSQARPGPVPGSAGPGPRPGSFPCLGLDTGPGPQMTLQIDSGLGIHLQ